jgi:hypothetical protein
MTTLTRRGRGPTRYKGIGEDARALGVTRNWLRIVLDGRGTSAPLLERYRRLKAANHPDKRALQFLPESEPQLP